MTHGLNDHEPRHAPFRVMRPVILLGVLAGLVSGCAARTQTPAWPEQPSPAYPSPHQEARKANLDEEQDRVTKSPQPQNDGTSRLAKRYEGKKALATLRGKATYYADSLAGNHTANGDIYDPGAFTAAHKKLAFGTIVRVVREDSGKATYVRINDRGPFGSADRIIDLSKAAAKELEMLRAGVVKVRVEVVDRPDK